MITNAWNEYRGWAKRSRTMQQGARNWNTIAMLTAALAALFGCAAGQVGTGGWWGRGLAFLAAVAAGLTPVFGRDILDVKREAGWIRARSTAEAIKSECFRFAARLGPYAAANAAAAFAAQRGALAEAAAREGLTPQPDPATTPDKRCPPEGMTCDWYIVNRLREQRSYYESGQRRHERAVSVLRSAILALAVVGVLTGAAAAVLNMVWVAPWVSVLSSLGALLVAHGLMDRRQFLAVTYSAFAASLTRIEDTVTGDLAALVDTTETLLEAEHLGWTERMAKSVPAPPSVPDPPAQVIR